MSQQLAVMRCECGRRVLVAATGSPYEFEWACECKRAGVVSWFHGSPPPVWAPSAQDVLFVR